MAFTIRQLQYFVAVAEQGTVSGAAQNLSISQSSVTEAIKELESDLGVELFERHPRGLNITHKGHQFLRHATKILADVSDARRTFFGGREATTGRLQLGVTSLVAGYVLSDLLARYRRAHPAVEITAIEDNGDYLEHLLVGGKLDIAVMVISNLRDRMALQSEILEISSYRLWLPLGHRLAAAEIINVGDIAAEPLIMLSVDEIEENTGKLLERARRAAACRLPHPLGRGGAQPGGDRRRRGASARPRLPAVVAGRRPHRIARYFRLAAGRAGRHGVAARLRPAAGGARFHRHCAVAADGQAAALSFDSWISVFPISPF